MEIVLTLGGTYVAIVMVLLLLRLHLWLAIVVGVVLAVPAFALGVWLLAVLSRH